jgi:hypothetical protein
MPNSNNGRVLLRTETDFVRAFQFLQLNGYPFFWSPEALARGLVVRVMDDDGETVGYVWGEWLDTGVVSLHAAARAGLRLPIFASDMIEQFVRIAFLIGADEVVTSVDGHPHPRPLERLLRRLGFEEVHDEYGRDTCFTLNTWSFLGHREPRRRRLVRPSNPDE